MTRVTKAGIAFAVIVLALVGVAAVTVIDLSFQVKGTLGIANGGTNQTSVPGTSGQLLYNNGGAYGAEDPIVSYNYANLLNAANAHVTETTASPVRISTFGVFGTLQVTYASITGSPVGCTLQLNNGDSLGNLVANGSAISTTPANGTVTFAVTPASGFQSAAQLSVTYACGTYPTAGTVTVDFEPGFTVGITNSPTVQPGNTANSTPWLVTNTPSASGGASRCVLISAASTNATNCKNAAGTIYGFRFVNTTATLYYLRLYNLSASPTCSSATGFIESIPIPANASGAGVVAMEEVGEAYSTGIGFCFTGGSSSTDNTNAATGVFGSILYK